MHRFPRRSRGTRSAASVQPDTTCKVLSLPAPVVRARPRRLPTLKLIEQGDENVDVVPIRSGLGFRLGYNVGYLKFTSGPTWNPF